MDVKRSEIWMVKLEGKGSEQSGLRPFIVISNDMNNKFSPTITGVPVTSVMEKAKIPVHVEIGTHTGLTSKSVALLEQTTTIDKKQRLIKKIGKCDDITMKRIELALRKQTGTIDVRVDYNRINRIARKIKEVDGIVSLCIAKGYDFTEDLLERSLLAGQLIAYCEQNGVDYNKYLPKYKIDKKEKLRRA